MFQTTNHQYPFFKSTFFISSCCTPNFRDQQSCAWPTQDMTVALWICQVLWSFGGRHASLGRHWDPRLFAGSAEIKKRRQTCRDLGEFGGKNWDLMGFNHRKDWFDQWIVDLWVCLKLDVHPKYGYLMENIGFGDTFIKKSLVLFGLYHWSSWAAFKWFFNDNPQLNILISSQETDAQLISLSGPLTVQLDLTGVISKFEPPKSVCVFIVVISLAHYNGWGTPFSFETYPYNSYNCNCSTQSIAVWPTYFIPCFPYSNIFCHN